MLYSKLPMLSTKCSAYLICDIHDLFQQMADGGRSLWRRNVLALIIPLVVTRIGPVGAVSVHDRSTLRAHIVPVTHSFNFFHFSEESITKDFSSKLILREINRGATNVYLSHKKTVALPKRLEEGKTLFVVRLQKILSTSASIQTAENFHLFDESEKICFFKIRAKF